jgi:hypothetical protein
MDADLTSFLKGRRLALARRQITMRAGLVNVDGKGSGQTKVFVACGAIKQITVANRFAAAHARTIDNGRVVWPRAIENPRNRKKKRLKSSRQHRAKRARRQAGNRPSDQARKNSSNGRPSSRYFGDGFTPKTTTAPVRGADGGRVLHRIASRDRDVMWELFIKWA